MWIQDKSLLFPWPLGEKQYSLNVFFGVISDYYTWKKMDDGFFQLWWGERKEFNYEIIYSSKGKYFNEKILPILTPIPF